MHRTSIASLALLSARAAAHGYIGTFTLDGVDYEGFRNHNPNPSPDAIGWSFTTPDEGPVLEPTDPSLACRVGSAPSRNYGSVSAGGEASFYWTSADKEINPDGWAESHRGPIMTYIAPCEYGDCTNADPATLRWTKIAEEGLISGTANRQGVWATDKMRGNGGVVSATIPANVAPGKYVLRNEIIALHRSNEHEPEFYGQCGNVEVTGEGTDDLSQSGTVTGELYTRGDHIFGFNIYDDGSTETSFEIPGPPLYQGRAAGGEEEEEEEEQKDNVEQPTSPVDEPFEEGEEDEYECVAWRRKAKSKAKKRGLSFRA